MSGDRLIIDESVTLGYCPGVRLNFDKRRDSWMLMAPERVLVLDDIASDILKAAIASPAASVGEAINSLAAQFDAPREEIASDVIEMLQDFADKKFISA